MHAGGIGQSTCVALAPGCREAGKGSREAGHRNREALGEETSALYTLQRMGGSKVPGARPLSSKTTQPDGECAVRNYITCAFMQELVGMLSGEGKELEELLARMQVDMVCLQGSMLGLEAGDVKGAVQEGASPLAVHEATMARVVSRGGKVGREVGRASGLGKTGKVSGEWEVGMGGGYWGWGLRRGSGCCLLVY